MSCGVCDGGCYSGCADSCSGTCTGCTSCSSCTGNCYTGCNTGCDGCDGCSGCSGTCSGTCNTTCTGTCNTTCTGTCTGSCTGSCTGDCNNACTSSSASTTIANLGNNIINKGQYDKNDFITLRDAIHNELARRGKTIPVDTFVNNPAPGINIFKDHPQKVFDDVKNMDVTKIYLANVGDITLVSNLSPSISYIKTLMSQNIK